MPSGRLKHRLKVTLVVLGALPLLTALIVALVLRAAWFQRAVEHRLNDRLAASGIRLSGLGGAWPRQVTLERLVWQDADGVWLRANALTLEPDLAGLAQRHLRLHALRVGRIEITRQPRAMAAAPGAAATPWPSLAIAHIHLDELRLGAALFGHATQATGQGNLSIQADQILEGQFEVTAQRLGPLEQLTATGAWRRDPTGLTFDRLQVAHQADRLRGKARLTAAGELTSLDCRLSLDALAPYRPFLPAAWAIPDIETSLDGTVFLDDQAAPRPFRIALRGQHLSRRNVTADAWQAEGTITTAADLAIEARLTGLRYDAWQAPQALATLEGPLDDLRCRLELDLTDPVPGFLKTDLRVVSGTAGTVLRNLEFDAALGEHTLRHVRPLTLHITPNAWTLPEFAVQYHDAVLEGALAFAPATGAIEARVAWLATPLPVAHWGLHTELSARLAGRLALEGSWHNPRGHLDLELTELAWATDARPLSLPERMTLRSNLTERGLDFWLQSHGGELPPIGARAHVPLVFHPDQRPTLDPGAPLSGLLQAAADYPDWSPPAAQGRWAVRGDLSLDLALHGTWTAPRLSGDLTWRQGALRDAVSGQVWKAIQLRLRVNDNTLTVAEGSAQDANGGRLNLSGGVTYAQKELAGAFEARLVKLVVARNEFGQVPLSGHLTLAGRGREWPLEGALEIPGATLTIPRRLPPRIIELELTPDAADPPDADDPAPQAIPPLHVPLDIRLTNRNALQVRGRGVDSEWKADLHLEGASDAPILSGAIRLQRGTLLLFGRRFTLVEGALHFDRQAPAAATLNLRAQAQVADTEVTLEALGPLAEPRLRLSSTPPLPQNEVLALLLFGTTSDHLSPFQAVSLAYNLNLLAGGIGALAILDRGQTRFGADQLELIAGDEDGERAALAVGKHLGGNLYLAGQVSLDGQADELALEYQLRPNLLLRTRSQSGLNAGLSLEWRREY